jgi:hypothetical protein
MVEKKFLDAQKIQSHLNAIKVMAQTLLNEVEKVEAIIEAKQPSNKALEKRMVADAEIARFLFLRQQTRLGLRKSQIPREKNKGK